MGRPESGRRTSHSQSARSTPRSSVADLQEERRGRRKREGTAGAGQKIAQIEENLVAVFNYYATVSRSDRSATEAEREGKKKPQRLLSGSRFQKMAYDANIIDQQACTHAQVDLIFRQASANTNRLNFEQFMDAMVLLGLSKFPDVPEGDMKQFHALNDLFDLHLSSFSGEDNDPLLSLVNELDDEWYTLLLSKGVAKSLHELYCRYFPIEVNQHYMQDAYVSSSQAQKNFLVMCKEFQVVRQVNELRAAMYATVRDAEKTAVPAVLANRIRVYPAGKYFTFHHFLMAIQKLADMKHKEGSHAQKIAQLLHTMEQARPPSGRLQFLPPGLVQFADEVAVKEIPPIPDEILRNIKEVYDWYITLGEPLKREMSTRKFNRFLRDAGLLAADFSLIPGGSQYGGSQAGSMMDSRMSTKTDRTTRSHMYSPTVSGKENALPLRVFAEPPFLQIDVDLIFSAAAVKVWKKRRAFSTHPKAGYEYRGSGEFGPGYYTEGEHEPNSHGASQFTHLDREAFEVACQDAAMRLYGPHENVPYECLSKFASDILGALMSVLVDPQALLLSSHVPAMDEENGHETALLLQSNYESLMTIWKTFRSDNQKDYWTLDDFWCMVSEFGIVKLMKPLTLRRIFFVHSRSTRDGAPRMSSFEAFLDVLVLIAEKMEQAHLMENNTRRVLLLLHNMNDACAKTRLAHLRPLFVLPPLPKEELHKERQHQGWKNMLAHLPAEELRELETEQNGGVPVGGFEEEVAPMRAVRGDARARDADKSSNRGGARAGARDADKLSDAGKKR